MSIIPWKFDTIPSIHRRTSSVTPLGLLQEEINQLFDDLFGEAATPHQSHNAVFQAPRQWSPALDIMESETGYKLRGEFPGMEAADLTIEIANGYLTLKGEKKEQTEEKDGNYLRRESFYGSFRRNIALPENANLDKAAADFKNGVLTLTVPKKEESKAETRTVQINSAA